MINIPALRAIPKTTAIDGVFPFSSAVVLLSPHQDRVPNAGETMLFSPYCFSKTAMDLPVSCPGIGGPSVGVKALGSEATPSILVHAMNGMQMFGYLAAHALT